MGYESRLFIIKRNEFTFNDKEFVYGQKLAEIEMCCMGHNKNYVYFNEIFKNPIDFDLYEIPDNDGECEEDFRMDVYGNHCCWATIDDVIKYMEDVIADGETYWRLKPAIMTLKAWKAENTGANEDPIVVHWGH